MATLIQHLRLLLLILMEQYKDKEWNVEPRDIDTKYDDSSTLIETDAGYITIKDKLTITYCNVSTKEYIDSRNTCKHNYCIPSKSLENWVDFKELWYKTFDMEICPYKILHSKGVKRL